MECWCLHGAVGMAADFREFGKNLATYNISSRAVDLWRFLDCQPLPISGFGGLLNADAGGEKSSSNGRVLLGYSMGGRLALHALLEKQHPWQAAVIVSAHPGLESPDEREIRRGEDARWATLALAGNWQDFLKEWHGQAVLSGSAPRSAGMDSGLLLRRREIARSFVDWSLGAQQSLWDRLHEITIPVLWVAGETDAKFLALAGRAAEMMPSASLVVAPKSGHRVPWDARDWLAEHAAAFFKLANA